LVKKQKTKNIVIYVAIITYMWYNEPVRAVGCTRWQLILQLSYLFIQAGSAKQRQGYNRGRFLK